MAVLTDLQANLIIYFTLAAFMAIGIYAGRRLSGTEEFFSMGVSQKPFILGVNFFATGMGAWVLFSLPEIATVAGILGIAAYTLACILPLFMFAILGPYVRLHSPDGFTMSDFIKRRFGPVVHWLVSLVSVVFMVVYMTSEMTALSGVIELLTKLDPIVPVAILALVTTIYTAYGGFRSSLITDGFQGYFIVILVIIGIISVSTTVSIEPGKPSSSGLLNSSPLGWKMIFVLPAAVSFADLFHQGFWQRVYAAETNRALRQSVYIAALLTLLVTIPLGASGLLAAWSKDWTPDSASGTAFFSLLQSMPLGVLCLCLILAISLVCSSVDTLQSALTAIIGGDLLQNRLPLHWVRLLAVAANIPAVALTLKRMDVLQLYLIGDLLAAATFPPILLGLFSPFKLVQGLDVLVGMLFGILSVPVVGGIAYGHFGRGWYLWIFPDGLYVPGWEVFCAFLFAPLTSMLMTVVSAYIRQKWQRYYNHQHSLSSEGAYPIGEKPTESPSPSLGSHSINHAHAL
ncbi:hypothetical protein BDF19DRAFT_446950 [Syncephalis fuscata]|nr:hypothetical protein BDF19DRAFT_446950 [Syncephalis fuscata]